MKELWIIDRIAGEIAVCEGGDRGMREFPLSELPKGAEEGDCLRRREGVFTLDAEETRRRRRANQALLQKLKDRKKEG